MNQSELSRWTHAASLGGIGRCVAKVDCVARSLHDLMFLKEEEIVVLEEIEYQSRYLGYCQGVVGRFRYKDVVFTTEIYRPSVPTSASLTDRPALIPLQSPVSQDALSNATVLIPFILNGDQASIFLRAGDYFSLGGSSTVYSATLRIETQAESVALKLIRARESEIDRQLVRREISTWSTIHHERILPFYGSCEIGLGQVALVSPLMANGNMSQYLRDNPSVDRLRLVIEVCEGLCYLHDDAGVVHGDLKCENVLVSPKGSALLGDFGLSTVIATTETVTATQIRNLNTLRYAAPELLLDAAFPDLPALPESGVSLSRSKTIFSDVYALGMLVYQTYTGAPPWAGASDVQVMVAIMAGHTPDRPEETKSQNLIPPALWAICGQVWQREPHQRPRSAAILNQLTGIQSTA
ncbi:kinase-like protein [Auricularia subglabra TFB-10046 SS5]|uniref:Kinase-like protein n=1 Tax=Auricularia subglabra (strain TFB-10046 / SS5) TaxID=717982 RepID=J0WXQ3_AURST|nr:kinase-like protein [Auricularia subglabra TFB-10046 SS5]